MAKQLKQCQDMIVEINEFSVSDEMLWVTGQTGRQQEDCSRVAEQQTNDRYCWIAQEPAELMRCPGSWNVIVYLV